MRIYTQTYNTNYASIAKAHPPLLVPNTKKVCFQIPFPSEGFLERVVIWQASGTASDFSVDLLNSQLPFPPGVYASAASPNDNLIAYRLQVPPTASLTQTAGNTLSLVDDDFGIGFRNIDGGWTLNQRYIYLLITPTSAVTDTTWNVTLQCRTDVG